MVKFELCQGQTLATTRLSKSESMVFLCSNVRKKPLVSPATVVYGDVRGRCCRCGQG